MWTHKLCFQLSIHNPPYRLKTETGETTLHVAAAAGRHHYYDDYYYYYYYYYYVYQYMSLLLVLSSKFMNLKLVASK